MAGLTIKLPEEVPPDLRSFSGVLKLQRPMVNGGHGILVYPREKGWLLFLPPTDELVAFIMEDKTFDGWKTFALSKLRVAQGEVEFTRRVGGHTW